MIVCGYTLWVKEGVGSQTSWRPWSTTKLPVGSTVPAVPWGGPGGSPPLPLCCHLRAWPTSPACHAPPRPRPFSLDRRGPHPPRTMSQPARPLGPTARRGVCIGWAWALALAVSIPKAAYLCRVLAFPILSSHPNQEQR